MNATFNAAKTVRNALINGTTTHVSVGQDGWEKTAIVGFKKFTQTY